MADKSNLFVTIELKEGLFFKLIEHRPITFICRHIPRKWVEYFISKNIQYKVGKNDSWHKLDLKETDIK